MIIITGANGFIGSCLLAELEQRGHKELIAVDPISTTDRPDILRHHEYSMFMGADQLFPFLKKVEAKKIEVIFHMGACSSTTETNEQYLRSNNTEYTQHLFSFCAENQIPFIYASSAATYGDGAHGFDDEKPAKIYKPLNLYGWSKLNFDMWAEQQIKTPPRWAGLRFFNVYGPNEYHKGDMSSVVYKAFLQIRQSGSLKLFKSHHPDYADGMQMRDFVYVKDVTRWMYEIWQAARFDSGIYNMGFGQARPWLDLASSVFRSLGKEMNIDWIEMPAHVRNQYQYFTEAKMTKFQQQGLPHPQYPIESGVADYVSKHLLRGQSIFMKTLPNHLNRYVVSQNYERYTSEDQAVWRFIMRQLRSFLKPNAHESYVEGLAKTGISTETIPRISVMDQKLQEFGWRAIPVSGFIPPAAFMEFQSMGFLPIASDMRTIDHILYTPAPDIVHEAAGHAPILIQPDFSDYLRKYASVARYSILSKEDLDQYRAIRDLSDIKENPSSTPEDIQQAERRLIQVNQQIRFTSEAGYLARMNWWTAEYGLIGSPQHPKIFGAGLLSSIGESRQFLDSKVKRIPLSIDCLNYSYDITEPQPQLFVATDFLQLHSILEQLAERMSYRRGGIEGVDEAIKAQTVNTVVLNSGLEISGKLVQRRLQDERICYLQFQGPSQLAFNHTEISGQGVAAHEHGFGTPVGFLKGQNRCLSDMTPTELKNLGIVRGKEVRLEFSSGVSVEGLCQNVLNLAGKNLLMSFAPCKVTLGQDLLFDPAWGSFDMGIGTHITSVFGGPADRGRYELKDDFVSSRVPEKSLSLDKQRFCNIYSDIRSLREQDRNSSQLGQKVRMLIDRYFSEGSSQWLIGVELLEWTHSLDGFKTESERLMDHLKSKSFMDPDVKFCVEQGLKLAANGL